jgi:AcrR family transcriptional regulator
VIIHKDVYGRPGAGILLTSSGIPGDYTRVQQTGRHATRPPPSTAAKAKRPRRSALIAATQDLVAEGGPEAATVRAIAERAGVTPGLIRHYFQSKDELIRAAYRALMDGMTAKGSDAIEGVAAGPEERLCRLHRRLAAPAGAATRALSSFGPATCTRSAATPI